MSNRLQGVAGGVVAGLVLAGFSFALAGCGLGAAAGPGSGLDPAPQATDVMSGVAHGGYAPIAGAYAQLFQSLNSGYGNSSATVLADNQAQPDGGSVQVNGHYVTGLNGEWSFNPSGYSCTNGSLLYVVISGGSSGGSTNNQILEIAPIGICGVTSGISTSFTYVNELSTVATAYALGNFMTVSGSTPPYTVTISAPANNNYYPVNGATVPSFGNCTSGATYIATGSNDVSTGTTCTASGLEHAYNNVANLVNVSTYTYTANSVTPGNANSSVPQAEINTLADILQECVSSNGYTSAPGQSTINYSGGGTATLTLTPGNLNDLLNGTSSITLINGTTTPLPLAAASNTVTDLETTINTAGSAFANAGVTATISGNSLLITAAAGTLTETGAVTDVTDDGTTCGALMALAPSLASTFPTNTLQAAMNIAKNPYVNANNVSKLYGLATAQPAFGPTLAAAPSDWTVAVAYQTPMETSSGVAQASGYAYVPTLDADDNVYVAENNVDVIGSTPAIACIDGFSANGNLLFGGTGQSGCNVISGASAYLDIYPDALGHLWTANSVNCIGTGCTSIGHKVLQFNAVTGNSTNIYTPATTAATSALYGLTLDKNNDVFFNVQDNNSGGANELANSAGTWTATLVGGGTTTKWANGSPRITGVDANSNLWGAGYGANSSSQGGVLSVFPSATVTPPTYNTTTYPQLSVDVAGGTTTYTNKTANSGPLGLAFDASGNVWVSNIGNVTSPDTWTTIGISKAVPPAADAFKTAPTISMPFVGGSGTSLTKPEYMQIDGANNLWVPDSTGYHEFNLTATTEISENGGFKPCYLGLTGTNTTCAVSYDGVSRGVGLDAAGDVWVVYPDLVNSSAAKQGGVFQIIGTGFPTWPLKAQQQPGIPAGCVTALSGGTCN